MHGNYSINGIPACANKELLTDILRNEWDFKGIVIVNCLSLFYFTQSLNRMSKVIGTLVSGLKLATSCHELF